MHGVLQLAHAPGRCQKRLGRHAAAVDARAADVVPLYDGHLQALERGKACYCCSSTTLPTLSSTPPQQDTDCTPVLSPSRLLSYSVRLPTREKRTSVLGSRSKPARSSGTAPNTLVYPDTRHSARPTAQACVSCCKVLGAHAFYCMQRRAVTAHSTANDRQIIVKLLSSLCQDSRQSTSPLRPSRTEPASSASAWCTVLEVQQQEGQEGVACKRSLLSVV